MLFKLGFTISFCFIYDKCISATVESIVVLVDNGNAADFVIVVRILIIGYCGVPSFSRGMVGFTSGLRVDIRRVI